MAASIQILCPNGRRQNVKVNANTKLLQILEEVCQRQGFVPPEDYKLIHGKKELDLSLSFRFSALPNNAKLELAKASSSRVEQDVTIALQLDSGKRLQDSFQPSCNIWQILLHFENTHSELSGVLTRVDKESTPHMHPVCIYMREEVIGEGALKAMTLKKLGLTSGKAIIRHFHRAVEEKILRDIEEKIEKERQKQVKLEEIALKKISELDQQVSNKHGDSQATVGTNSQATENMETDSTDEIFKSDEACPDVSGSDTVVSMDQRHENSDSATKVTTVVEQPPRQEQKRQNRSSQQLQQQQAAIESLRNLNIPGVEIFTPDDFHDLSPQEQAIARQLAQRFLGTYQQASATVPARREEAQSSSASFADFKFPESTRGMDLTSNDEESSMQERTQPCDREAIVYDRNEPLHPGEPSTHDSDVADSFFEVTQADVKLMYRDLQNAVQQLEDQPLMTNTMRRERTEAVFDAYDRVVVRVQFPDQLILQGLFKPREPVSALTKFVKDHLADKAENIYLYTSPPKQVISDQRSSLAASHLAPAALVYVGTKSQKEATLSDKIKQQKKSRLEAESKVDGILRPHSSTSEAQDTSTSGIGGPQPGTSGSAAASRRSASSQIASSSASRTLPSVTQVPKWLKLGKK